VLGSQVCTGLPSLFDFLFFLIFCSPEIEPKALRELYHLSHAPSPFVFERQDLANFVPS
jgi:hypothetical protein